MKFVLFAILAVLAGLAHADSRDLIGSCTYDSTMGATGGFHEGNVLANVYRSGDGQLKVVTGITNRAGSIADRDSLPSYETGSFETYTPEIVVNDGRILKGTWVDREAAAAGSKMKSGFGYTVANGLGKVQVGTGFGSYVQNYIVHHGTVYPPCIFWELP